MVVTVELAYWDNISVLFIVIYLEVTMKTRRKRSIIWTIAVDELKAIIATASNITDILEKLGFCPRTGGGYKTLMKRLKYEGIEVSKSKRRRRQFISKTEDILTENSNYCRAHLKVRLIKEGLLENKCGIYNEWNGEPLSLQLDHKNGINNDNRLDNLRFLCPNCHSQTDNYSGKAKKI